MQQILLVTVPFFALVLRGWAVARGRLLPLEATPGLTAFVLFFALPCIPSAARTGADAGRIARIVLFATAASFVSFSAAVALLV